MREWITWIKELRPTRAPYLGPDHHLSAEQWVVERAYIVFFRLTQQCEREGYEIKTDPFDTTVTRLTGLGWAGITMNPGHGDNDRGGHIPVTIDAAYEQYGNALCVAFNRACRSKCW